MFQLWSGLIQLDEGIPNYWLREMVLAADFCTASRLYQDAFDLHCVVLKALTSRPGPSKKEEYCILRSLLGCIHTCASPAQINCTIELTESQLHLWSERHIVRTVLHLHLSELNSRLGLESASKYELTELDEWLIANMGPWAGSNLNTREHLMTCPTAKWQVTRLIMWVKRIVNRFQEIIDGELIPGNSQDASYERDVAMPTLLAILMHAGIQEPPSMFQFPNDSLPSHFKCRNEEFPLSQGLCVILDMIFFQQDAQENPPFKVSTRILLRLDVLSSHHSAFCGIYYQLFSKAGQSCQETVRSNMSDRLFAALSTVMQAHRVCCPIPNSGGSENNLDSLDWQETFSISQRLLNAHQNILQLSENSTTYGDRDIPRNLPLSRDMDQTPFFYQSSQIGPRPHNSYTPFITRPLFSDLSDASSMSKSFYRLYMQDKTRLISSVAEKSRGKQTHSYCRTGSVVSRDSWDFYNVTGMPKPSASSSISIFGGDPATVTRTATLDARLDLMGLWIDG